MIDAINEKSDVLGDRDLDCVSGGGIKGALQGVCTKGERVQNDPAQMFQQILQQLSQGQG